MLTDRFFVVLTTLLQGELETAGPFFIAVGQGLERWDRRPPELQPDRKRLTREIARKQVQPRDIRFLDAQGRVVNQPTPHMQVAVTFGLREAVDALRECGLFGAKARAATNSGTLLSYHVHPVLKKTDRMRLTRTIRLDLTPQKPRN